MYVRPDKPFECKTTAQSSQVISMLVLSILLRSLEQINTCSTFSECLMPNCLLSLRAETAVKCSSTGPSLIIFPFKCRDKENQTAVLFRKMSRLWADKISFFILCLLLHSLCHGASISFSSSFFQRCTKLWILYCTLRRLQSQSPSRLRDIKQVKPFCSSTAE